MSRTVEEIREKLLVEENLYKIEEDNRQQSQEESQRKDNKVFKTFLIAAVFSNLVFAPILHHNFPEYNIFISLLLSFMASFVLLIIMMFVYTLFFSNPTTGFDIEASHSKLVYLKKIRKLEFELLAATTGAKIIRVINDEIGKEWHNVIIGIDGKAKEYYVSFPRDDKGCAYVECYEFIDR